MELVIDSLFIVFTLMACIVFAMLARNLWLDAKTRKSLNEVADTYHAITKLRYKAALDELAKEDDGR